MFYCCVREAYFSSPANGGGGGGVVYQNTNILNNTGFEYSIPKIPGYVCLSKYLILCRIFYTCTVKFCVSSIIGQVKRNRLKGGSCLSLGIDIIHL